MGDKNSYKNIKKAYEEILSVINKHKDSVVFDYDDLESKSERHLFGIELKERYGFNVNPKNISSLDFIRFSDFMCLGWYGNKYNRTISWEDNGKQPKDELLLELNFSTGAYIFGNISEDDYPTELFQEFFQELKSYKFKYIDSVNKSLYFEMDNAGEIFNEFPKILAKYYEKNKEDYKLREIKRLSKKLEQLKIK